MPQRTRTKKISDEIAVKIKKLITEGEVQPGDRLPSERDLAVRFSVSRPSIREAIMTLDAMGMVQSVQGGGTFVKSLAEPSVSDPLSTMMEQDSKLQYGMVEVRMGLESWSAYLAAKRATDEDKTTLKNLLNQMTSLAKKGKWDVHVDAAFHMAVTAATHNTLQVHLMKTVQDLIEDTLETTLSRYYSKEEHRQELLEQHLNIFHAIVNGEPEEARSAMMEHLVSVEEKLLDLFS